jgi:hypothetical protein
MLIIVEDLVDEWVTGETVVLGGNLPQYSNLHHRSRMISTGLEPGRLRWETGD